MKELPVVWLINLLDAKDLQNKEKISENYHYLKEQFAQWDFKYKEFAYVRFEDLSKSEQENYDKELTMKQINRRLLATEIEILYNHIKLWEKIVEENLEEVLILQSNVRFGKMLVKLLENREHFHQDWEMIQLANQHEQQFYDKVIVDIYRIANFDKYFSFSDAYLLKRNAAKKLLDFVFPLNLPLDLVMKEALIEEKIVKGYGIEPKIVALVDTNSLEKIDEETINYYYKRCKKSLVKLKRWFKKIKIKK